MVPVLGKNLQVSLSVVGKHSERSIGLRSKRTVWFWPTVGSAPVQ